MGTAIWLGLKFTVRFMVTVTARLYGDVRVRVGHVSAVLVLWGQVYREDVRAGQLSRIPSRRRCLDI